jgi:hypothetical protein
MQRPLRSQSPKRVGSGPEGPPISRRRAAGGAVSADPAAVAREAGSDDGTEGSSGEFFSELIGIYYSVPEFSSRGHERQLIV